MSDVRIERALVPDDDGAMMPRLLVIVPCDVLHGKEHTIVLKSIEAQQWAGMLSTQANQLEREYHSLLDEDGEVDVTVTVPTGQVEDDDSSE